jgi:hypothetical protein
VVESSDNRPIFSSNRPIIIRRCNGSVRQWPVASAEVSLESSDNRPTKSGNRPIFRHWARKDINPAKQILGGKVHFKAVGLNDGGYD